jgi:RecB family endonuclease NucS
VGKALARTALAPKWKRFVKDYGMNLAYWYQPKGLAVTVDSVAARLKILKEFEHKGAWRDLQSAFVKRLNEDGVSKASDDWDDGGAPLARMLKQVMAVLGLAWVDPDDQVEITKAGDLFLSNGDPSILARQALRYQFWNPVIEKRDHGAIRLHPVPFLVGLLQAVGGYVNRKEYRLFVAKALRIGDVDKVAEQIDAFRELTQAEQGEVVRQCDAYKIAGIRRGSILNTIKLNEAYALKMWMLSDLIEQGEEHCLRLKPIRGEARNYLNHYSVNGTYIAFADEKEFLSWMGDPDAVPDQQTALDIYVGRNDIEAAAATAKNLGATAAEVRNFKRMLISEKTLEDNIERNFEDFGKRIGRSLELLGRQYPTTVGPIDLLGRDKKTGQYVVVELKKGRSADKVFGQLSRYMGWVKKNLANGGEVAGAIVGAKIDDKLRAARDAHGTKVDLVEFQSRMSVNVV